MTLVRHFQVALVSKRRNEKWTQQSEHLFVQIVGGDAERVVEKQVKNWKIRKVGDFFQNADDFFIFTRISLFDANGDGQCSGRSDVGTHVCHFTMSRVTNAANNIFDTTGDRPEPIRSS